MANKATSELAKRASLAESGRRQCMLRRHQPDGSYDTQFAWLPADVRSGQTVKVDGLEWVVAEAYGD